MIISKGGFLCWKISDLRFRESGSDIDVVAHFAKQELKSVITFEANDAALGAVTAVYGLDEKAEITSVHRDDRPQVIHDTAKNEPPW